MEAQELLEDLEESWATGSCYSKNLTPLHFVLDLAPNHYIYVERKSEDFISRKNWYVFTEIEALPDMSFVLRGQRTEKQWKKPAKINNESFPYFLKSSVVFTLMWWQLFIILDNCDIFSKFIESTL